MQCKQCNRETKGRSQYCSESCKTVYNRNKRKTEQVAGVPAGMAEAVIKARTVSLEHYHAHPELYVPRLEPDKLNWGPWMDSDQLAAAGLKANRVSIPGDWDYTGAAVFIPGLPLSAVAV